MEIIFYFQFLLLLIIYALFKMKAFILTWIGFVFTCIGALFNIFSANQFSETILRLGFVFLVVGVFIVLKELRNEKEN